MSDPPPVPASGRSRVLLVHRYFWPDTPPYAAMLRAIAAHWAAAGHDVEVLASQPSYKPGAVPSSAPATETLDGFRVRRLRIRPDRGGGLRRPRNMVWFSLLVALRVLFGPRRDVVMCSTVPQVLLGWAMSWAARLRGTAFIYHCMDLHPEIGRLSGEFANPIVYRLLMRLDLRACRQAAVVVVLSEDMRAALVRRDPALGERIMLLNNFDLPEFGAGAVESPIEVGEGVMTVAFAGNLGRFQRLDVVVAAVLSDHPGMERVRLVLMGEGAAKDGLVRQAAAAPEEFRRRVLLLPHGSSAQARALMRVADWGLVSLAPHVIRYAYPSKTATYLSEGLPVLVAVEAESTLARDVETWGVGSHLPLDTPEIAARALVHLAGRGDEVSLRREQARSAWRREFSVEGRLEQWDALLAGVGRRQAHDVGTRR